MTAQGGGFGCHQLGLSGLTSELLSSVLELCGSPSHQTSGIASIDHFGNHILNGLQRRNGLAKGVSLQSIIDSAINTGAGNSQGLSSHTNASSIQGLHGNFESFAFLSEKIVLGDANVFKNQVRSGTGTDSQLIFLGTQTESFRIKGNDKGRNSLVLEG